MRTALVAALLAIATSAAAQGPYSVDFSYSLVAVEQGQAVAAPLSIEGNYPISVPLTWTYTIQGYPTTSGTIYLEPGAKEASFPVSGPITPTYVGALTGTAGITYQLGAQQPVTKSVPLYVHDFSMSIALTGAHVAESDDLQTLTFTISKPASMPLTVRFWGDDDSAVGPDYSIVDTEVLLPAGATSGEMHFRVPPDDTVEGGEAFTIQGELWEGNRLLSLSRARIEIAEREIRALFVPEELNVFAGDPFSLMLVLSDKVKPPLGGVAVSFATTNANVVSVLPEPMLVSDSTTVGTMNARAGSAGDAIITADFPSTASVIPAQARIHVYGGAVSFGAIRTLVLAPGQTIVVPVQMTPVPPERITLFASAGNVVEVASSLVIGTDGKGSLVVTGKKSGSSIIEIDSPGRQRITGLEVVVSPSRTRSVRH